MLIEQLSKLYVTPGGDYGVVQTEDDAPEGWERAIKLKAGNAPSSTSTCGTTTWSSSSRKRTGSVRRCSWSSSPSSGTPYSQERSTVQSP